MCITDWRAVGYIYIPTCIYSTFIGRISMWRQIVKQRKRNTPVARYLGKIIDVTCTCVLQLFIQPTEPS